MVAEGAKMIRLPIGQGISGTVAEKAIIINIPDAYQDERFDSSHDQETGYRTKSILCVPVKNGEKETVGVLMAINKHDVSYLGHSRLGLVCVTRRLTHCPVSLKNPPGPRL